MKNNIICFNADTQISTPSGTTRIQDIKPFDEILSFNHILGNIEILTVKKTASSNHEQLARIVFDDGSILEMTLDHPIWIINKGWAAFKKNQKYNVVLNKIDIGDFCLFLNENYKLVNKKISKISFHQGYFKMYILSGGEFNNFFANGCLVHDENLLQLDLINEGIDSYEIQTVSNVL